MLVDEPTDSVLVTRVKRDSALLERVTAGAGDLVTVLDVSLGTYRNALVRLLEAGARVRYYDHHIASDIPTHYAPFWRRSTRFRTYALRS